MTVGRNERCPCGSGKKFKRCCGEPPTPTPPPPPAPGKFRFEPGCYSGPGAVFVPSILCQKRVSDTEWIDHFVLTNADTPCQKQESAVAMAQDDLTEAFALKQWGGTDTDLAMSLRSKGYKRVTDFNVLRPE
jgi:hypothetical protein